MMRIFSPARALLAASAVFAAAAFSVVPVAAQNQGNENYPSRLETFRDDAGGFFGKIFGSDEPAQQRQPEPYGRSGQVAQMSSSDMMMRINSLEAQIRQMTGQVEELQHRNRQLEDQLRRVQGDNEYLTNQRAGGRGGAPAPQASAPPTVPSAGPSVAAAPPVAAPPPAAHGRRSDVFDPREDPNAPGVPRALGSLPPGQPSAPPAPSNAREEVPASVSGGRAAGEPLDLSTLSDRAANDPALEPRAAPAAQPRMIPGALPPPPPRNPNATGGQILASAPSDAPRDEFALAYGYVQRKDYALAEEALRAFLQKHPTDRLASDANYWLGETLFQRQRYRDAAESFLAVSTRFERSEKAPDALLRLGQSLAALGEHEAACATLGEVLRKFPRAGNSLKQSVGREQKRARC
ncbi:MAG: tol-pal system protein YbgF [Variibacter sp.]